MRTSWHGQAVLYASVVVFPLRSVTEIRLPQMSNRYSSWPRVVCVHVPSVFLRSVPPPPASGTHWLGPLLFHRTFAPPGSRVSA